MSEGGFLNKVLKNINDAITMLEYGESTKEAATYLFEAGDLLGGRYKRLLMDLGFLSQNLSGSEEEVNELSRELFGEDCITEKGKEGLLKCVVKVRDWIQKYFREEDSCVYDVRAPKDVIEACKLTGKKLSGTNLRIFATNNGIGIYDEELPIAVYTNKDGRRTIMVYDTTGVGYYNEVAKETGVHMSCRTAGRGDEVICNVESDKDVPSALAIAAYQYYVLGRGDLRLKYAEKLELDDFKELISGGE